jgi:maltose-binding protein MalE
MSSVWEAWGNATFLIITQELDASVAYTDAANQIRTLIGE